MAGIPFLWFQLPSFPATHLVSAYICEGEGLIWRSPAPSSKALKVKAVIAIDHFGLRGKTCRKPSRRQFDPKTSLFSFVKHRNLILDDMKDLLKLKSDFRKNLYSSVD